MFRTLLHIILLSLPILGLAQEYSYQVYTINKGLVQMQVLDVFQDSRGYIWAGTKAGVSRFDGKSFKNFGTENGLPHDYIHDIAEDSKGNLWFPTRHGLARFDGAAFDTFTYEMHGNLIMTMNRKDQSWIMTDQEVIFFNGTAFSKLSNQFPIFKEEILDEIYFDDTGNQLLILFRNGDIYALREGNLKNLLSQSAYRFQIIELNKRETFLDGRTEDGGQLVYQLEDGQLHIVLEQRGGKVFTNKLTQSYFFTENQTLYKVQPASEKVLKVHAFKEQAARLKCMDNIGHFWLASEEGLVQFFGEGFENYTSDAFHYIWAMVEDNQNRLWLAKYNNGLYVYDGEKMTDMTPRLNLPNYQFYFNAQKNRQGDLFFPVGNYILTFDGQGFENMKPTVGPGRSFLTLFYDKPDDRLLAGTAGGVLIIEKDKSVAFFGVEEGIQKADFIRSITKDNQGQYWLGNSDCVSVINLNKERNNVQQYTSANGNSPTIGASAFFKDSRGTIWMGSAHQLLKYDRAADQIVLVAGDQIKEKISFIIDVDSTQLLIGAVDGLYVFDLSLYYQSGKVRMNFFNQHSGFLATEPNQDGAYKDSNGHIWVASSTHTTKLIPEQLNQTIKPLQTHITEVNDHKLNFAEAQGEYLLPQGINDVFIRFEALGFSQPKAVQFEYKKEGLTKGWENIDAQSDLNFTNLSPGLHQVQIRAVTPGLADEDLVVRTFTFRVDLKPWQHPKFTRFLLWLGGITLLGFIVMSLRLYLIRRRARKNEQKVRYLEVQTLQAQMNPHFIFNVLGTLQNLILNSDTIKANEHLVKLSLLIRRFLDSSIQSDLPKSMASRGEITLEKELELLKMYLEFEHLQYPDAFDYSLEIEPGLNLANLHIPPMIIQPYVENAVKHGLRYKEEKGFLKLTFKEIEEGLICRVEDDGVGRAKAKIIQQNSIRMFKSHGTDLVEKRVAVLNQMGYDIEIETHDRPLGGTIVNIKIAYKI